MRLIRSTINKAKIKKTNYFTGTEQLNSVDELAEIVGRNLYCKSKYLGKYNDPIAINDYNICGFISL